MVLVVLKLKKEEEEEEEDIASLLVLTKPPQLFQKMFDDLPDFQLCSVTVLGIPERKDNDAEAEGLGTKATMFFFLFNAYSDLI